MRACLLALELARRSGESTACQAEVYYSTLMRFAGCAATSHEAAASFGGDDIAVRARGDAADPARPIEALRFLAGLGTGVERLRVLARAPKVPGLVSEGARADCEVGADLTRLLELPIRSDRVRAVCLRTVRREGCSCRAIGRGLARTGPLRGGGVRRGDVRGDRRP
jgi:hypothetical protein